MVNPSRAAHEPNWFPYRRAKRRAVEALIRLLYSDATWRERWRLLGKVRTLGRRRWEASAA
jgi:hypothetical protein